MSLLGFDALGALAVGQPSRNAATNTMFAASPATLAFSGRDASFKSVLLPFTAGFASAGVSTAARLGILASPTGWLTVGTPALCAIGAAAGRGTLTSNGISAASIGKMLATNRTHGVAGPAAAWASSLVVQNASYQLAGNDVRFGRDYETWFPLEMRGSAWIGSRDLEGSWLPAPMADAQWQGVAAPDRTWDLRSHPTATWTKPPIAR